MSEQPPELSVKRPEGRSLHADKFRVAIAGLVGIALGAVVVAVAVLLSSSSSPHTATWSSWSPATGAGSDPSQIADYIAPFYRVDAAEQLDVISVINLGNAAASTNSGTLVAVNSSSAGSQNLSLLSGKTVAYNLCGLGSSTCTVAGTASTNRLLLLRREALELALYTFEYDSGTQYVIAVLPPGHTTATTTQTATPLSQKPPSTKKPTKTSAQTVTVAVLFARDELQPFLAQPLGETLESDPPDIEQLSVWRQTEEAGLVDQITARGLFSEKMEQQQDGGNLLVLNPLPSQ
jgi:hypothetical protein